MPPYVAVPRADARLRRNIQIPKPTAAKNARPPMTPPTMAPTFGDDFFVWLSPTDVLVEVVEPDDGEPERSGREIVEGTGASVSG